MVSKKNGEFFIKTFKSLLVILTVLVAGQAMTANTSVVAEARRQQAAAISAEKKEKTQELAKKATKEKARIREATLVPFGDEFDSLELSTKYNTALTTIKVEIKKAQRALDQAKQARKAFQTDYKKNPAPYLAGDTQFPVFNIQALESVLAFAQKIKAQLDASLLVADEQPQLVDVTEAE